MYLAIRSVSPKVITRRNYRLCRQPQVGGFSPLPGSKTRKKDAEKRSHRSIMAPQQLLGPNQSTCLGTLSPQTGAPEKALGTFGPQRRGSGGWRRQKSPSVNRCPYTPPLNPELPGMWWEVSAAAAELACTIDQFLTSDRSPDSGARRVRNWNPRNLGPDCSSGQGLLQSGLCTTFLGE